MGAINGILMGVYAVVNQYPKWAVMQGNLSSGACVQHRHRPACASAQSAKHLCYSLFVSYVNLLQAKFEFSS